MDCGVLKETKLTNIVYVWESSGFQTMAMETPSAHRIGIAIFYCKAEHFAIKELCLHGPNIISFQLMTGRRRCHVVGCYIARRNDSTI